jgi:hypothetical protein
VSNRRLLFQYNSTEAEKSGDINMIRVYSDGTYTADGRRDEIIPWKLEDGKVWWRRRTGVWEEWHSNDFIDRLSMHLLESAIEDKHE